MDRRKILRAGLVLTGMAALPAPGRAQTIARLQVDPAEVFRTTVCLRPFRARGPRIETETVGRKVVIHNYGHGGSGWSLSWGSGAAAVRLAMQSSPQKIAVIGAGALGLTAAITAQRAGADVTIYTKERFPFVRSARATGSWTPDSRVALASAAAPDFAARWEAMARASLTMHDSYVGTAGQPVEWITRYILRRNPQPQPVAVPEATEPFDPGFIQLRGRLWDVSPAYHDLEPGTHPFAADTVRAGPDMTFNVAAYARQLEADFLAAGGRFVPMEFHTPSDLSRIKEKVVIDCTGYGARALWKDESIVPIRGQIVWLVPQPQAHYGLYFRGISVVSRRDGVVVQQLGGEGQGWNDDNEEPDMAAAQSTLERLKTLYV